MDISLILWVVFIVSSLLFLYVGKSLISQPDYNIPEVFKITIIGKLLVLLPQLGLLSVLILGFALTDNGFWYLGAVIFVVILFAPRPNTF